MAREDYLTLPEYFDYAGRRYRVVGTDESTGKLKYYIEDLDQVIEETTTQVIERAKRDGIFAGKGSIASNPRGGVLRSEFIFQLWVDNGSPGSENETDAGEETYYKPAIQWFNGKKNLKGLYNYRDLEGNITWLEVAYILTNVYTSKFYENGYSIENTEVSQGTRVSAVYIKSKEYTSLDENLVSYKQEMWMKPYIDALTNGSKYLPFPVYASIDFLVKTFGLDFKTSENKAKVVDGQLVVRRPSLVKYSWCVSEITRKEAEQIIQLSSSL